MVASEEGLEEAAIVLITQGASINVVGFHGSTALHEASADGHVRIALR